MDEVLTKHEALVADVALSLDTLFGGDVQSSSKRVLADAYFSGKELPEAYYGPLADEMRESSGLSAEHPDKRLGLSYIHEVG